MKRRSFETYRDIARKYLLPAFGTMKLSELTREHVQKMYARKRETRGLVLPVLDKFTVYCLPL